jgi:membrane protease YdiL (CAAX protease family)
MWGPGIAALIICAFKVKQFKMFSIFGTSIWRSCLIFFLPFIAISVLNQQPKLFFLCGFALTSTLGEELGWRFFLQNTLTVKSRILKYIIIGSLWEFWHFTTRTHVGNLNQIMIRLLIFYSLLIFMSFLIGEAYNKTKSILVAVTLHLSFNLALSEEISKGQVAVAIVVPLYLLIILFWPKENI